MTDLIFPAFEPRLSNQRKPLYAALLTDVARSASDSIEALKTFRGILYNSESGPKHGTLMAFDAHVGDTACHLRAGMLLEIYSLHRVMAKHPLTGEMMAPIWIDEAIQRLIITRDKAQKVCLALTRDRAPPRTLGLGCKDLSISKALGAVEWEEVALSRGPLCLYQDTPEYTHGKFEYFSQGNSTPLSPTSSNSSQPITPLSTESEFPSPFRTQWDIYDNRTLLRFVIYCFVLSKYKSYSSINNSLAARLYPEAAAELGYSVMKGFWDFKNPGYRKAGVDRIIKEFRVLQLWLSDLSCSWLHCIAMRCDLRGMGK